MIAKGLISEQKFTMEDARLSDVFDIHSLAIEYGDSLKEVKKWDWEEVQEAKMVLGVRAALVKDGK